MANIFSKVLQATDAALDAYIQKSRTAIELPESSKDRKGFVEIHWGDNSQYGYKEKRGLIGPPVLKNMARRDSIVSAIIQTRASQVAQFAKPQKDRYSPGFRIFPVEPADISSEDKMKLADPALDEEAHAELNHELEKKKMEDQQKQEEDMKKISDFVLNCGMPLDERDTTYKRMSFEKFLRLLVQDRLTYNYTAIEMIPTKGKTDGNGNRLMHHFYPVCAGSIRYVSNRSAEEYNKMIKEMLANQGIEYSDEAALKYRYVQILRGKIVAAWSEDEFVYEPGNPTVDPEDNGYAPGELEFLIQIITSHLYAEAHNRNFFTQGIGSKGLLHIKGDNISRGQLEGLKRQWDNMLTNSRNAFRPPIIGMADEVKWVPLAQTNREMEFQSWMEYLIRIACAVFQIDPSEINFDISKSNTSTLNESSNEARLKSSRDKGLRPLLVYLENLYNDHILPAWNPDLAAKYKFKFVGLDAETKDQEIERFQKEVATYKTINEIRTEMGLPPIEDGDIILNAAYTQFKQMMLMNEQEPMEGDVGGEVPPEEEDTFADDLDADLSDLEKEIEVEEEEEPKKDEKPKDDAKKSMTIEYHHFDEDEDK